MRLQPAEPAFDGRHTAALVGGLTATLDQARRSVDVPGLLCVPDRGFRLPTRLVPFGCADQERGQDLRFGSRQIRTEQLPEEMVVAIPLPTTVERHQEQVGAPQRFQNRRGAALLEDRVTEWPRQPLEDRGASEKAELVGGQVREQLGLEVVRYEAVAPGEGCRALGLGPARPDRQPGEVETCGPALRVLRELADVGIRQIHTSRAQQLARLRCVHAEVVRPHLQLEAPRLKRCERQRRPAAGGEGQL